jgi:hypothetical protein
MLRNFSSALSLIVLSAVLASSAYGLGEDILAHTGQYTFFIKPDPTSHVTFYQKMVPCVKTKIIPVARRIVETYPVPVPVTRKLPVLLSETPVGCDDGADPCIECFPKPSTRSAFKDVVAPRMVPARIPSLVVEPRAVTRRIMLPQWFAVEEIPKPPPRKIRKVSKIR